MTRQIRRNETPKPGLTRQKVLRHAVTLADKKGVDQLSMRKLAQGLGVEAMSLYNHVKNKDDLLDGMVSLVVEQIRPPEQVKAWKQELRQSAISTHTVLMKHHWATQLLISRVNVSHPMMKNSDAWLGCLHHAGFSYELADHAWNALSNHIYGFTLTVINSPVDAKDYSKAASQYLPLVPETEFPHVHAMMQLIISGKHNGINNFEFGLDLILDGLEKIHARS